MPVTNGSEPVAPGGGHKIQAGADLVDAPDDEAWAGLPAPADEEPREPPAPEEMVAVVAEAAAVEEAAGPGAGELMPPDRLESAAPLPVVAAVCAAAGLDKARISKSAIRRLQRHPVALTGIRDHVLALRAGRVVSQLTHMRLPDASSKRELYDAVLWAALRSSNSEVGFPREVFGTFAAPRAASTPCGKPVSRLRVHGFAGELVRHFETLLITGAAAYTDDVLSTIRRKGPERRSGRRDRLVTEM